MSNLIEIAESYRILEITPGASLEEVERAYESLSKSWDPRRFGGDEARRRKADKKLRQLDRAYQNLRKELGADADDKVTSAQPSDLAAPEADTTASTTSQRHWTRRWRFLWLVALFLSLSFLGYDSYTRLQTIDRTTNIAMTNYPLPEHDPKSSTGYPGNQHRLVLPALGTDGQHWTMQTERMLDGREGLRVRHVDYDGVAPINQISGNTVQLNSSQAEHLQTSGALAGNTTGTTTTEPEVTGRDVHWSSSLHWLSAGLAWVEQQFTHQPIAYALEDTVQWANTFALAMVMLILPLAMVRRFGSIATALLVICFIAVYPYYEFSFVGYFDHHGLAATSDLLIVLLVAGAGAGWLRNEALDPNSLSPVEKALWQWLPTRRQAKRWMIASGIAVGTGLWVSTASIIPALAGVGIAALISTGFFARTAIRCTHPALKNLGPWIIGGFILLGTAGAFYVFRFAGLLPVGLGLVAGVIALAGASNGSVLPWLVTLAIALSAFFADAGGNFWAAGNWMGVWGGIAGAGLGQAVFLGLTKNSEEKISMGVADPTLWRVWGCAAGMASLFFYLLEYAPSHFTMRLEVNHPFYALALFGAGDALCRLSWFISGQEQPQSGFWKRQLTWVVVDVLLFVGTVGGIGIFQQKLIGVLPLLGAFLVWLGLVAVYWIVRYFGLVKFDQPQDQDEAHWRKHWLRLLLCLAVISLLPATVLLFGEKVFVIRMGGFLLNLHQDYILEFRSFLRQMSTLSPVQIVCGISMIPLAAAPIFLLFFATELQRVWKAVLLVAALPAMVMLGFATMQIRWLGISCAMWSAALAVAALVTTSPGSAFRWRDGFRRPLAVLLLTIVLIPFPMTTMIGWLVNRDTVGDLDLQQIVTRDVSERLRTRLGNETGVILSGPTTTTWMMYFGGFHGIGSLYWENVDGLKAAGEIYSADRHSGNPNVWDEAKALIDKYHITHIAIFSWDPFAIEYARLGAGLRLPKGIPDEISQYDELKDSFIVKLWWRHLPPPVWLRFVPYTVPTSPLLKGNSIMLLEVVPPQKPIDANLRMAQYLMGRNTPEDLRGAQIFLSYVLQADPTYYPGLITRAMLDQILGEYAARTGDTTAASAEAAAYKADAQEVFANLAKANNPDFAFEDRVNLSLLLFNTDHRTEAAEQIQKCFETATETDLRHLPMDRLLVLLQLQAHSPEDIKSPQKTLDLALSLLPKPLQGQILAERAGVLATSNQTQAQAITLYREAIKLNPDFEPAMTGLAKLLVLAADKSLHNGADAIELANKAAKATRMQTPENIQVLACASAELGKFDDAVFYGRMALMLLKDINNQEMVDLWSKQLTRFENHQTFQYP